MKSDYCLWIECYRHVNISVFEVQLFEIRDGIHSKLQATVNVLAARSGRALAQY